jgi:phenylpyruvate C(3)-methyltransferase
MSKNSSNNIFNSAIVASAVSAACELEILDEMQDNRFIDIKKFCYDRNLYQPLVASILSTLCCYEICTVADDDNLFKQGSIFDEIYHNKGFFLWLVRGNGTILRNLATMAKNEKRIGNFVQRDGAYIAIASRDQGSRMVDPYFERVLNEFPFNTVVDLGCGTAERLINLTKKFSHIRALGIDINSDAVKIALSRLQSEGVEGQLSVLQGDMTKLLPQPEFLDVDTIFSFFSGHDLWPHENCVRIMRDFKTVFPNVKRFLLCDTYRSGIELKSDIPIFTMGFELIHASMGQYIPSITEWMALFAESGWECVQRHDVEVAYSSIFDLRPM